MFAILIAEVSFLKLILECACVFAYLVGSLHDLLYCFIVYAVVDVV